MSMMCVLRQATFCKLEPKHFTAETTGCYNFTEKVITRVSLGEGARAAIVTSSGSACSDAKARHVGRTVDVKTSMQVGKHAAVQFMRPHDLTLIFIHFLQMPPLGGNDYGFGLHLDFTLHTTAARASTTTIPLVHARRLCMHVYMVYHGMLRYAYGKLCCTKLCCIYDTILHCPMLCCTRLG